MNKRDLIKFLMESNTKSFYVEDLCAVAMWDRKKMLKFLNYNNFKTLTQKFNNKWQWSYEWWRHGIKMSRLDTFGFNIKEMAGEELPEGVEKRIKIYNKQYTSVSRKIDLEIMECVGEKVKWDDNFHEGEYCNTWGAWVFDNNGVSTEVPFFSTNMEDIVLLLKKQGIDYSIDVKDNKIKARIGRYVKEGSDLANLLSLTYVDFMKKNSEF